MEVPLPRNPLKYLNSYLIKGPERNLLIDTGFNQEVCKNALLEGLQTLEVALEETDIFITHLHADHSGLVSAVATDNSTIFCGAIDADIVNLTHSPDYWSEIQDITGLHGFPLPELRKVIERHPGNRYNPDREHVFSIVKENDIIDIGEYHFTCIETPGHTPGHICLYEPTKKILVSGDCVLDDITPNITFEKWITNPLGHYLDSLDKLDQLEINLVLPGHRRIIKDSHKRIGELKEHHKNRLNEVLNILNDGPMNGYQVASKMTWDVTYPTWDEFPKSQRFFATGEAITHLELLWYRNLIRKIKNDGQVLFELII